MVREFGVETNQADTCCTIFEANMRYVGLIRVTPGGDWLSAEATPQATADVMLPASEVAEAEAEAADLESTVDTPAEADVDVPADEPLAGRKRRPNRIFIGHGRNHKPLEQLTKTLDNLNIPYLVAQAEAHAARPISKKVRDTMEQCGAAILIFSADVEYFDKDGNSVWRPSENVSNELGAASVMYDDRIILFKEDGVTLASNYNDIGHITFAKDALDAKVNDLLRELVAFKILKLALNDE